MVLGGGAVLMAKTVSGAFLELLGRLDLTADQAETASTRATALKDFFDRNFTMAERSFTIGSYRRGTLVRPERDIDLLAPLDYTTYKDRFDNDSRAFLYFVRDELNDRYALSKVSSRGVAVLLDFNVIRADVVPAFRRMGGGYFIPDGRKRWTATNPDFHTRIIRDRDRELGERLKPLIRLMKFWNIQNGGHLRSFHVELMVWTIWKRDGSIPTYSVAVMQTIDVMRSWLKTSFDDPWDGGGRIDAYLSSHDRAMVRRMLDQDAKSSAQAEEYRKAEKIEKAFDRWNSVFRRGFPAYG
jgi:hypothetical protein